MHFIGLVSTLSLLSLATAIKVQDPIFHSSEISAHKHPKKCHHKLDLTVKQNVEALYDKLVDKEVKRIWVSKNQLAILREDGHLYLKIKYGKQLKVGFPYVCGTKPYHVEGEEKKAKGKKTTAPAKKGNKKSLVATKAKKPQETEFVEDDTKNNNTERETEVIGSESAEEKPKMKPSSEKKKPAKKSTKKVDSSSDESNEDESESSDTEVLSASSESEEGKKGKLLHKGKKRNLPKKHPRKHSKKQRKHHKKYESTSESETSTSSSETTSEHISRQHGNYSTTPVEYNEFIEFLEQEGKIKRNSHSKHDKVVVNNEDLKAFFKHKKHH